MNSKVVVKFSAILIAIFLVVACSKKEPESVTAEASQESTPPAPVVVEAFLPLKVEAITFRKSAKKCKASECATVTIHSLRFPDNDTLTKVLEKELLGLTSNTLKEGKNAYETYADNFLAEAKNRYYSALSAEMVRQKGALVLIQVNSEDYTGGAHGMPYTGYLNYDRHRNQKLSLDDVVIDGQRSALVEKLKATHTAWLNQNGSNNADYLGTWPFVETDNFALTANGLVFKYQAYAIAPYSEGQPELLIPYPALKGIIKPEWVLPE